MADKFMYIPNDDTQNYPFCSVKLGVETFEHSNYKTLGTSVINSPVSLVSLIKVAEYHIKMYFRMNVAFFDLYQIYIFEWQQRVK